MKLFFGQPALSCKNAEGNRQVIGGAFFFNVRRSEIDSDTTSGKFVAGILDGRANPIFALSDSPLRQTDGSELRQTQRHIDLDLHQQAINPNQGSGYRCRKHALLLTERTPEINKQDHPATFSCLTVER